MRIRNAFVNSSMRERIKSILLCAVSYRFSLEMLNIRQYIDMLALSSRSASPDAAGQSLCSLFPPGFPAVPHYLNHTSVVTNPSQNRACAIYAHGSSHSQFTENPNILTMIRGSGKGKRFNIFQNFCQSRQPRLPRRFSHLNSSFLTSLPYLLIPRRLSVTP